MRPNFFGANAANPGMNLARLLEWGISPLGGEILSPLSSTREIGEISIFPMSAVAGYNTDPGQGQIFQGISWASYGEYPQRTGANHPYVISGAVRDAGGNPVIGATVRAFRTVDNVLVTQTISGPGGQYAIGVPDQQQYYLVAYRAAPDIIGTTVNTLVGS
jgi:hypothetical protein